MERLSGAWSWGGGREDTGVRVDQGRAAVSQGANILGMDGGDGCTAA